MSLTTISFIAYWLSDRVGQNCTISILTPPVPKTAEALLLRPTRVVCAVDAEAPGHVTRIISSRFPNLNEIIAARDLRSESIRWALTINLMRTPSRILSSLYPINRCLLVLLANGHPCSFSCPVRNSDDLAPTWPTINSNPSVISDFDVRQVCIQDPISVRQGHPIDSKP